MSQKVELQRKFYIAMMKPITTPRAISCSTYKKVVGVTAIARLSINITKQPLTATVLGFSMNFINISQGVLL